MAENCECVPILAPVLADSTVAIMDEENSVSFLTIQECNLLLLVTTLHS